MVAAPTFLSAIPATSGQMLSASLNVAGAVVGAQALRTLRSAAVSAGAAPRVSVILPALSAAPALSAPTGLGLEPAAVAMPVAARQVHFAPSFLDSFDKPAVELDSRSISAGGPPPRIVALALAYNPDSFFNEARKRNALFFKLSVGSAVILAGLGLIGIGGGVFAALLFQKVWWPALLGGIGLANWVGLFVFKPLDRLIVALRASTQLDLLIFRLRHQLDSCAKLPTLEAQHECQTKLWDSIQRDPMFNEPPPSTQRKAKKKTRE